MNMQPGYVPAAKGIALSASLLVAGGMITTSHQIIPSILHALDISTTASPASPAKAAAQQFALVYKAAKDTQRPAELVAFLAYGILAWYYKSKATNEGSLWQLYTGAAAAVFATIPYTITVLEGISFKLVTLANTRASNQPQRPPVTRQKSNPGLLSAPRNDLAPAGAMTPAEEFEPYDDSPFSVEDYERMKVTKMLRQFNTRNSLRAVLPALSGLLGLWAVLSE